MRFDCYFCGKPGADPPFVDGSGIGWLPSCMRCWEEGVADDHAESQRQAKKQHDKKP